jgi:hypothetical protein
MRRVRAADGPDGAATIRGQMDRGTPDPRRQT